MIAYHYRHGWTQEFNQGLKTLERPLGLITSRPFAAKKKTRFFKSLLSLVEICLVQAVARFEVEIGFVTSKIDLGCQNTEYTHRLCFNAI